LRSERSDRNDIGAPVLNSHCSGSYFPHFTEMRDEGNHSMEIIFLQGAEDMKFSIEIMDGAWSREALFENYVKEITIARMNFSAYTRDFILNFDYDGDGTTDESKLPDLIKESRPGEKSNSIRYLPAGGKLTLFIGDVVREITIYAKDNINDALIEVKELEELPVIPPPGEAIYKNITARPI
jgi:hypothetical protein